MLSTLISSKQIVVSVCAAIAMVLGAMSVGASVFVTPKTKPAPANDTPFPAYVATPQPRTEANRTSIDHTTPDLNVQNSIPTPQLLPIRPYTTPLLLEDKPHSAHGVGGLHLQLFGEPHQPLNRLQSSLQVKVTETVKQLNESVPLPLPSPNTPQDSSPAPAPAPVASDKDNPAPTSPSAVPDKQSSPPAENEGPATDSKQTSLSLPLSSIEL